MLQKFELTGVHMTVDDHLRKYVTKKIGRLDKYLPRACRASAHAVVELKENKSEPGSKYTCAVVLHLPHEDLAVSESTVNIYAAADIVEVRLKQLIRRYRDQHLSAKFTRRILGRFRRRERIEPEQAA
ncbi:MAG TPA: ribosome-associated translation inhibitor RaiA [Candidatus Saccharimonadales bacterium]